MGIVIRGTCLQLTVYTFYKRKILESLGTVLNSKPDILLWRPVINYTAVNC